MSEPQLVSGVRGIDSDAINAAANDARRLMAKTTAVLDQLLAAGLDISHTIDPRVKLIGGYTLKLHIAIAKPRVVSPVSAVADPSDVPPA